MNDSTPRILGALLALALAPLSACSGDDTAEGVAPPADPTANARPAATLPTDLFVASAPAGAVGVRQAITSAKVGDDLVVRGVIGGRAKVFVDGRAILVAIDPGLESCGVGEGCETPWDYCCETRETLLANTMTVQVAGAGGTPIETSLKGVHGLEELATIVVTGTVRSVEGSVVLDADRIHVVGG